MSEKCSSAARCEEQSLAFEAFTRELHLVRSVMISRSDVTMDVEEGSRGAAGRDGLAWLLVTVRPSECRPERYRNHLVFSRFCLPSSRYAKLDFCFEESFSRCSRTEVLRKEYLLVRCGLVTGCANKFWEFSTDLLQLLRRRTQKIRIMSPILCFEVCGVIC